MEVLTYIYIYIYDIHLCDRDASIRSNKFERTMYIYIYMYTHFVKIHVSQCTSHPRLLSGFGRQPALHASQPPERPTQGVYGEGGEGGGSSDGLNICTH